MRQRNAKSSLIARLQIDQLQGLNIYFRRLLRMDLHNFADWPSSIKVLCWILLLVLLLVFGYFVSIKPQLAALAHAQEQQEKLLNDLKVKQKKLIDLQQNQAQLQQLKQVLQQQFAELPQSAEMATLLEQVQRAGAKSGLKIKNIRLESTVQHAFLLEQPIMIEAEGDYHAFGRFASVLTELPQLLSVHDFAIQTIESTDASLLIPKLEYRIQAKTYRYAPLAQPL